jgi:hypothetical protein
LASVEGDARSIWLEVWFEGGSPSGHAAAGAARQEFVGWLGLMAAVEALADQAARPAPREARANRQEEENDD